MGFAPFRGDHSWGPLGGTTALRSDDDRFLLGVVVDPFGAVLFAVAAVFGAAEWQLVVRNLDSVDPRVARLELVDRTLRFTHIAGKDARSQSKLRCVGFFERFVEILDTHDWQQWTKRFFGPDARAFGHVDDDRWLKKVTLVELFAGGALATRDHLAAALDCVCQLRFDLGALFFGV